MNEGLLKLGQKSHAAGGGGDELELFRRVDGGALGELDVKSTEDDARRNF